MQEWQACGVGKGMKIKHFDSKQDVSGLERAHEWSQEAKKNRKKRSKTKSKACNSDLVNTYASLEPSYILTFSTLDDADEHMILDLKLVEIVCIASETGANLDPVLPRPLPKWRINTTNDTKIGVVFSVVKSALRTCVALLRKPAYHINFLNRMCPIICIQR